MATITKKSLLALDKYRFIGSQKNKTKEQIERDKKAFADAIKAYKDNKKIIQKVK